MVRCTTIHRICNKQYNYPEHWLFTLFSMLYRQEVPLPFNHALTNPSDGTMQPATTNSLINTVKNATAQLSTTNAPELAKIVQNYIQNAKKKMQKA